ncbi:MAG: class I SAM-dependent methyltransferase [Candidatus Kapaibacterium sp.]
MFSSETPNGIKKRFEYISSLLAKFRPKTVLDFGSGTGTNLTIPLAEIFPETRFLGVDSDSSSVDYANSVNTSPNLSFALIDQVKEQGPYDLIIASEVIEHVDEPGELLLFLRENLTPRGKLILTMPNGYGPFEMTALVESLLFVSGIHTLLHRMAGFLLGKKVSRPTKADTLAVSPHVNFFSFGRIRGLIGQSSYDILEYRPRTFVCGLGFHQLLFNESARLWNARVADSLPPQANSGWMFVLEKNEKGAPAEIPYRRGLYERVRKKLNAKRWGLA